MNRWALMLFATLALVVGCGPSPGEPLVDLVLVGGHLIDVASGETLRERDV